MGPQNSKNRHKTHSRSSDEDSLTNRQLSADKSTTLLSNNIWENDIKAHPLLQTQRVLSVN